MMMLTWLLREVNFRRLVAWPILEAVFSWQWSWVLLQTCRHSLVDCGFDLLVIWMVNCRAWFKGTPVLVSPVLLSNCEPVSSLVGGTTILRVLLDVMMLSWMLVDINLRRQINRVVLFGSYMDVRPVLRMLDGMSSGGLIRDVYGYGRGGIEVCQLHSL